MGIFQPAMWSFTKGYLDPYQKLIQLQGCRFVPEKHFRKQAKPQMVFLSLDLNIGKFPGFGGFDWGPNLQIWIGISHSFLGFLLFHSSPQTLRDSDLKKKKAEVHPLQTLLLAVKSRFAFCGGGVSFLVVLGGGGLLGAEFFCLRMKNTT